MQRFDNTTSELVQGVAVSLQFDSSKYKRFESLTLQSSSSVNVQFATDEGLPVLVEASALGVFRVRIGQAKSSTLGLLARTEPSGELSVEEIKNGWRVTQGEDALEILAQPLRLRLIRRGEAVLHTSDDARSVPMGRGKQGSPARWTAAFALGANEAVYGLGESAGGLSRRGEVLSGARDAALSKQLPFCWSPAGWGLYVHTASPVRHGVGASAWSARSHVLDLEDACLDLFLFVGDPSDVLNHFTQLSGRATLPPLWSLGVWIAHPQTLPAEGAVETARLWRERGVPCDGVTLLGAPAWEVKPRLAFEWNHAQFADARRLFAALKGQHVKVCMSEYPYVAEDSPMFRELADKGWFLRDEDGEPVLFQWDGAPPGESGSAGPRKAAFLDLTHPEAYATWRDRHRGLFEDGADVMHTALPVLPGPEARPRQREAEGRLATVYPLLYNRCLYEATQAARPNVEPMVWSADGYPTAQRTPVQWQGETASSWEAMAGAIRAALSWGMSGVPCSLHDLGSMTSAEGMSPALYLRWLAQSVFSSHFRLPGLPGLEPWAFGDEHLKQVKTWLAFRYRLIPYVMGAIEDAQRNGLPVMRSMALAYPRDHEAHSYELQYLLGPALLVAPIATPEGKTVVHFPRGDAWWDLNTGWRYEGGTTWTFELGLDKLPVFGREGHMLCLGPSAQHTGEFNSAKILDEVWMFGMPLHNPCAMRNRIRVMQMQGSSYAKGLEGLKILPSEGLEIKRRGAEVRISRKR